MKIYMRCSFAFCSFRFFFFFAPGFLKRETFNNRFLFHHLPFSLCARHKWRALSDSNSHRKVHHDESKWWTSTLSDQLLCSYTTQKSRRLIHRYIFYSIWNHSFKTGAVSFSSHLFSFHLLREFVFFFDWISMWRLPFARLAYDKDMFQC